MANNKFSIPVATYEDYPIILEFLDTHYPTAKYSKQTVIDPITFQPIIYGYFEEDLSPNKDANNFLNKLQYSSIMEHYKEYYMTKIQGSNY